MTMNERCFNFKHDIVLQNTGVFHLNTSPREFMLTSRLTTRGLLFDGLVEVTLAW